MTPVLSSSPMNCLDPHQGTRFQAKEKGVWVSLCSSTALLKLNNLYLLEHTIHELTLSSKSQYSMLLTMLLTQFLCWVQKSALGFPTYQRAHADLSSSIAEPVHLPRGRDGFLFPPRRCWQWWPDALRIQQSPF